MPTRENPAPNVAGAKTEIRQGARLFCLVWQEGLYGVMIQPNEWIRII